jgi:hypothetical protein
VAGVEAESPEQARYAAHDRMPESGRNGKPLPAGTEITAVLMPIDVSNAVRQRA